MQDHVPARVAQAAREHHEVEHERRVGEREVAEVDREVRLEVRQDAGERATAQALRRAILIPPHPEDEVLFVQGDDGPKDTLPGMVTVDDVEAALSNVIDPELGLDFVELGLIYGIDIDGGDVHVTFSLTTPACPIGPQVTEQIDEFVSELDGVNNVTSSMVFTPPWSPDRMSEDAKFALGY